MRSKSVFCDLIGGKWNEYFVPYANTRESALLKFLIMNTSDALKIMEKYETYFLGFPKISSSSKRANYNDISSVEGYIMPQKVAKVTNYGGDSPVESLNSFDLLSNSEDISEIVVYR